MTRKSHYPAHFSGNIAIYLYIIWIWWCQYDLLFFLYYLFINNNGISGLRLRNPYPTCIYQIPLLSRSYFILGCSFVIQYKLHIEL